VGEWEGVKKGSKSENLPMINVFAVCGEQDADISRYLSLLPLSAVKPRNQISNLKILQHEKILLFSLSSDAGARDKRTKQLP
jgi:hypothetical protein